MKKSRVAITLIYAIFAALEVAAIGNLDGPSVENKGNCSYKILIETTCTKDAGTSDHISLRFGDSNSNDVLIRHLKASHIRRVDSGNIHDVDDVDDAPAKPFRACGVDQFQVVGSCVESPVCYLYLKQRGKDRWRPGMAQVLLAEDSKAKSYSDSRLSSKSFYFRRFLPPHVWHGSDTCDTEVTPFGIKHTRKGSPKIPLIP